MIGFIRAFYNFLILYLVNYLLNKYYLWLESHRTHAIEVDGLCVLSVVNWPSDHSICSHSLWLSPAWVDHFVIIFMSCHKTTIHTHNTIALGMDSMVLGWRLDRIWNVVLEISRPNMIRLRVCKRKFDSIMNKLFSLECLWVKSPKT